MGSRGDSYDNALAESVIGLDKAAVIHRDGPWRGFDDVEYATLKWVAWFNMQRLLQPLGYLPPAEYEAQRSHGSRRRGRTQLTEPPRNPGRFTSAFIEDVVMERFRARRRERLYAAYADASRDSVFMSGMTRLLD